MTPFIESVKSDWKTLVFYFAAGLVLVFTMPIWAPTIMALCIGSKLQHKYTTSNKLEPWEKVSIRQQFSVKMMMTGLVLAMLIIISLIGNGPGALALVLACSIFAVGYATRLRK